MKDNICTASQARIASELGITRKCVNDNLDILVEKEFLKAEKQAGKTNIYVDTGKAGITIKINGGVTESYNTCNLKLQPPVTESYTKIVVKKQKDNSNENEKPVFLAPPKPKISNAARYSLAVTIAEVCHVSYEAMQGRLFKVAKEIAQDERVTPELIRKVFSKGGVWYSQDWRGQKGQPPGIGDIAENLFKWDISEVNVIHGGLKDRPVKEKGGLKVNG